MSGATVSALPSSVDATRALLAGENYLADRSLAVVVFLALRLGRPLFLEGDAGVGKTEIAKALAAGLGRKLIRLQCYEGLDATAAVYEWNYLRQVMELKLAEAAHSGETREQLAAEVFSERFLLKRPLLQALEPGPNGPPVLLIDEVDRADEPFEAYLLEMLADFQVTVPELGTFRAAQPPIVLLTSNRTREVHDALKRRCLYHWLGYPDAARELQILRLRAPESGERLARHEVAAREARAHGQQRVGRDAELGQVLARRQARGAEGARRRARDALRLGHAAADLQRAVAVLVRRAHGRHDRLVELDHGQRPPHAPHVPVGRHARLGCRYFPPNVNSLRD